MAGSAKKVAGVTTRNGKPVWTNDENTEPYSEKSATFEYGDGVLVSPTINPTTGEYYKLDDLFEHYEKNGPYDLFTGEKLPVFDDEDTATDYSKWRSKNILNEDLTDEEFYTGESEVYSKKDGSEVSMKDRIKDAMFHAGDIRNDVAGFFGGDAPEYALGGLATSKRGITTQEGLDMANQKYQRDDKKADTNEDGELSTREKEIADAVQKNELVEMSCGGMMSDPVSGNPIPVGSSAENVRDDIEAMISEGEYVLPANVVKWHGLKHIMDMQAEAEMGLMGMYDTGLIKYAGEEEAEEPEEVTEAEDDVPSEEIEIEVAAFEVDDMLDEDEEVEEVYPKTSKLPGMINTPKMVFMS